MYLKRLELSGFKSFAKSTVLEFPSKITAVVGPNGSGKSNIKEGIQWVLGEQSMKSLRGKRGEDLIWNGSPQVPRMGKASVALVFDNKDGKIPLEFEDVTISRKIFRDGMNEYFINNSQTRLKDVVELMARIGLGETKHNIIGQGEVDRILLAGARERREVLEEALGLRVYQLKKHETERKLRATENNMKQVEALVREIAPHLKFLKAQAKKAETRGSIEDELKELEKIYFAKEEREIAAERQGIEKRKSPFVRTQKEVATAVAELSQKITEAEKHLADVGSDTAEDRALAQQSVRIREIEREVGRLEGKLEIERERMSQPKLRAVDTRYIKEEIETFISEVRSLMEDETNFETFQSHLAVLVEDLEGLMRQIDKGTIEEKRGGEDAMVKKLEQTIQKLQEEASHLNKKLQAREDERSRERDDYRKAQFKIRELDSSLRARQDEERDVMLQLERIKFEEERVEIREQNFMEELKKAAIERGGLARISFDGYEEISGEDLRKKIERMRGKLEEIGGIDPTVVKEYEDTESRYTFLTNELEDLKKASSSLKELIKELDQHIKKDFKEGFSKIKDEFHNYFRIIFGGGKASLQLVKLQRRGEGGEDGGEQDFVEVAVEEGHVEEGIDISVDLPRKRIRGLAMLSGGERALTSIALLFAITAVNPPPFLILDETDAALDEANSQRYAAILRELSKKTQLILVTHNRETMKCAGILYGVTMGADGVSKLLSLKLEEAEVYTNR